MHPQQFETRHRGGDPRERDLAAFENVDRIVAVQGVKGSEKPRAVWENPQEWPPPARDANDFDPLIFLNSFKFRPESINPNHAYMEAAQNQLASESLNKAPDSTVRSRGVLIADEADMHWNIQFDNLTSRRPPLL